MSARVNVEKLSVLDEIDSRMRLGAARLGFFADDASAGPADMAAMFEAAAKLSARIAGLGRLADRMADAVSKLGPGELDARSAAAVASGWLARGSLERACTWADRVAEDAPALAARALADCGRTDAAIAKAEALGAGDRPEAGSLGELLDQAEAFAAVAALGREDYLDRARELADAIAGRFFTVAGSPSDGTDPSASARWMAVLSRLFALDGGAKHLDRAEEALHNHVFFAQTADGGAAIGRTLDGSCGHAGGAAECAALACAMSDAAGLLITSDDSGALVSGISANSMSEIRVGESSVMRCLVQTQLPARGWTSWLFEPHRAIVEHAPKTEVTRRTTRKQRMLASPAPVVQPSRGPEATTFRFKVRVPGWSANAAAEPSSDEAASRRRGPGVRIDGKAVNAKPQDGCYVFDIPTDRATKIEATFDIRPAVHQRKGAISWGVEIAIGYGPLILSAVEQANPGEDVTSPFRIVSQPEEFEVIGDIRRRQPLVQVKAMASGGRTGPLVFAPLGEIGGFPCPAFRTWNRWGR